MPSSNVVTDEAEISRLAGELTVESADKLREIEISTSDRDLKKLARKALYNLKLKGITPTSKGGVAATAQVAANLPPLRVYSSACDGAGNRLLLFVVDDPDGGSPTLLQVLTNDLEGVQSYEHLKVARREVAERISRLETQLESGMAFAEIEADYGRWLLTNARAVTTSRGKRSPQGFLAWIPLVGEPSGDHSRPIYKRVSAEEITGDETIPTDPAALFELSWFDPWFFAAEDTVPWLPQWERLMTMPEDAEDRESEMQFILNEAISGLMTEQMRVLYKVRLEETADILWRCGKQAEAKQALYHAISLGSDAEAATVPFTREIVYRTLGAAVELMWIHRERRASEQG